MHRIINGLLIHRMMSRRTLLPGIALLLASVVLISSCSPEEEEERPETPESAEIRPEVVFTTIDDRPLHIYIESQGIVEANRVIVVRPRISGFVRTSALEDGAFVQQGDTLISFVDEEWQYQLQQAENEYESALLEYDIERRQRQNNSTAGSNGNGSNRDDNMLRISTGLAQAELELERARLDLSYTSITAPYSGFLSVPDRVNNGAYIATGSELGTLIEDRKVRVRLDVLEAELHALEQGMTVTVTTPSGTQKEGVIRAITPIVNPESKTGQVLVEVPNQDRLLKPGMTVEGRIQIRSHSGTTRVPRSAILERDGGRTLVFKLNNGRVEWVYVDPETMTPEWAIVNNEDISPGDTLAVGRHFALSHMQPVTPRMAGQIVLEDEGVE